MGAGRCGDGGQTVKRQAACDYAQIGATHANPLQGQNSCRCRGPEQPSRPAIVARRVLNVQRLLSVGPPGSRRRVPGPDRAHPAHDPAGLEAGVPPRGNAIIALRAHRPSRRGRGSRPRLPLPSASCCVAAPIVPVIAVRTAEGRINMDLASKPSVLFVYFTYTNQTRKVMDAMAEVPPFAAAAL